MDFVELLRALSESGTAAWEFASSNWDPARAIPIIFAALTFLTSVYLKYRNSGFRLVDRLEEFITAQEQELTQARLQLLKLVEVPSPVRSLDSPAIDTRTLDRTLRKMNWGFGKASVGDLEDAKRVSFDQARLAEAQSAQHTRRRALAHLLLGARSAARNYADPIKRNEARSAALAEFNMALDIDPKDADALEFSGMMLLELCNPAGARDRFDELIKLRAKSGGEALGRAYRLLAAANENLPTPRLLNASNALTEALKHIPEKMALEKAATHEHQGMLRTKLRQLSAANTSYQNALAIYLGMKATKSGQEGLARASAGIAEINRLQNKEGAGEAA